MFCPCSTDYDGAAPNSHVCPVCLGLPGALPVINRRAVELVLATGLAIEASAPAATRFDRKSYAIRTCPRATSISQYDLPLASAGRLTVDTSDGPFTVMRVAGHTDCAVDYVRTGNRTKVTGRCDGRPVSAETDAPARAQGGRERSRPAGGSRGVAP